MNEKTLDKAVMVASILVPVFFMQAYAPMERFGVFALIHVGYGFLKAMVTDLKNSRPKDAFANYEDVVPADPPLTPSDGWINTDVRTGAGREALDIEVPVEVRRWAEGANKWTDEQFVKDGTYMIVIAAVPNISEGDQPSFPFHMSYTMSKQIQPDLFLELVNGFNIQIPALFEAHGTPLEEEGGH